MAVDADKLSNEELVKELAKYGENITLPLKPGRREILVKKLNHFRVRDKASSSTPKKGTGNNSRSKRRTLDALSSDDSEVDSATSNLGTYQKSTQKSTRRRSAAISRPTPDVDDDGFKRPSPRSRRSEPVIPMASLATNRTSSPSTSKFHSRTARNYIDNMTQNTSSKVYDFNEGLESSDSDTEDSIYEVQNKSVNTTLPYDEEDDSVENSQPVATRSRSKGSSTSVSLNSFRNEFNTSVPVKKTFNKSKNSFKNTYNDVSREKKIKKSRFYPEHISEVLVIVVIVFFVLLVFGYMFVKSDSVFSLYDGVFSKGGTRFKYLLCDGLDEEEQINERCYTREEVDKAMIIIHDLYDLLSSRAGDVECGYEVDKDMTAIDFKQQLKDMKHKRKEVIKLFNACTDHIIRNPQWKLRVFTEEGKLASNPDEVATFESTVVSKGLGCRISQLFYRVTNSIIIFIAVCGLIYVCVLWMKHRSRKNDVQKRDVYKMVEDIIDILKERCDSDSDGDNAVSYMAVQHVRDQLLPPSKRHELQPVWDKAVKFIEANESRIRLETQRIQGEEFEVWRWIHSVPNGGKVWQGQAFGEHNEASTSPVRYSPTPCLKVKNMFDGAVESGEEWYEKVENAILEKTEGVADIVHMYVDEDSKEGCVYVKCSSREAAGKARQCLHGWWFDGRLITARYLRLEHYHKQFPESIRAVRPLCLQKQQRSSLQQPYFRSTLEMT